MTATPVLLKLKEQGEKHRQDFSEAILSASQEFIQYLLFPTE